MLQRISNAIITKANRKSLIITAIFFVVMQYLISISPFGIQAIKAVSPGVTIPDMQFNYLPEAVHQTLLDLNVSGRVAYFRMLLMDFVFIISYTLFFMVSLILLARFFFPNNQLYRFVWIIPLASGKFDALENCCFLVQLKAIPETLPVFATISNVFTLAKFFTYGICEVAFGIGGIVWLVVMLIRSMKKDWQNTVKN